MRASQESYDDEPSPLTNPKIRISATLPVAGEIRPVLEKRMSHFNLVDEEYEMHDSKAEKVLNDITKRKIDLL